MCFSATASFTVAAVLAPVAAYTIATGARVGRKWLPLAVYPLAFAVQQAIEGVLWLGVNGGHEPTIAAASRGFLIFSHLFWPAWVPYSVYRLERDGPLSPVLLVLAVVGALLGLSLAVPAIVLPGWLSIEVVKGSLEYHVRMIYDGYVGRDALRIAYAIIVAGALFLSRERLVQLFGALIVVSLLAATTYFEHAFISVWCYFAAVLSVYIAIMLAVVARRAPR